MSATRLTLSGGATVIVHRPLAETQRMLTRALHDRVMLEIESPDGDHLVVNPYQVQYLQEADE